MSLQNEKTLRIFYKRMMWLNHSNCQSIHFLNFHVKYEVFITIISEEKKSCIKCRRNYVKKTEKVLLNNIVMLLLNNVKQSCCQLSFPECSTLLGYEN